MNNKILKVENVTIERNHRLLLDNVNFTLDKNESLAIIGPSGSGKTTLCLALSGKIFYRGKIIYSANESSIAWIEQQHHFKNLQNTNDLYYQQRFNSYDTEETENVGQSLGVLSAEMNSLIKEMGIEYLLREKLIQLSNGENKKLQLLKARFENPGIMILDQPFIGLDKEGRAWLHDQLNKLIQSGILIILITTSEEIPGNITHVLELNKGRVKNFLSAEEFHQSNQKGNHSHSKKTLPLKYDHLWHTDPQFTGESYVIELNKINVEYAGKKILENISWNVKYKERWLITGPNGAGKSTLLSLLTADNPKAYANDIYLFGKKRGSGESIWDIKRRIGFISPEFHFYFNQASSVFETVASGLFDTIGLFRNLSDDDIRLVNEWMEICNVSSYSYKSLFPLSLGEQRAVLLTRALVKNPPLLILDEPLQGLDGETKNEFLNLINEICIRGQKTLIYVSHYENEIPACITNKLKIDQGRVIAIQ